MTDTAFPAIGHIYKADYGDPVDGRAVVGAIKGSGRKLTTIYGSVNDPDYYFSLPPVKAVFPEARVIAAGVRLRLRAALRSRRQ